MVEVDGGVRGHCRTRVAEGRLRGVSSINSCNGRNVVHVSVAARHELDVHRGPNTGGVDIPRDGAVATFVENIARTRLGGYGIRANDDGSSSEDGAQEERSEHVGMFMKW